MNIWDTLLIVCTNVIINEIFFKDNFEHVIVVFYLLLIFSVERKIVKGNSIHFFDGSDWNSH